MRLPQSLSFILTLPFTFGLTIAFVGGTSGCANERAASFQNRQDRQNYRVDRRYDRAERWGYDPD